MGDNEDSKHATHMTHGKWKGDVDFFGAYGRVGEHAIPREACPRILQRPLVLEVAAGGLRAALQVMPLGPRFPGAQDSFESANDADGTAQ